MTMSKQWYRLDDDATVASPALLVYPERVAANIGRMIELAGDDPRRLRPHVKTHKLAPIVTMQLDAGITRFKCATIAEMEMTASAGAPDVLLAYQPIGPTIARVAKLRDAYPDTRFSVVADDVEVVAALTECFREAGEPLPVFLDVDCGMHRTGIDPGPGLEICRRIAASPGLIFGGLHAYDGHIRDRDSADRAEHGASAMEPVTVLAERLERAGISVAAIVAGGSPTFAIHARTTNWQCSPGTTVFWDAGNSEKYPDLEFVHAAVLLARVISRPGGDRVCVDLGHKAVASENPIEHRVRFPEVPDARPVLHSEEHLVIETSRAEELSPGTVLYGIPWHICPSVALYSEASVVRGGRIVETWPITARARRISV